MKQIVLTALFLILGITSFAQSNNGVTVNADPRIDQFLNQFKTSNQVIQEQFIYKIQLISTYDRAEATKTRSSFAARYPSYQSFFTHDGVKYLVRIGDLATKTDAEVLLMELRKKFPSAFILPPEKVN